MHNIWLLTKVTFKQGIRSRILAGIAFLSILLFVSNIAITNLFAIEMGKVMVDIGFSVLSLAGLSIIFFLGIGLVSHDIHDRTVCMVISRPFTRWQYILGKYGGLALILLTAMAILGVLAILSFFVCSSLVSGLELPRDFSWLSILVTISFNFLSLLVVMSFAFFFTIISSSIYLAMLFTVCIYFIGHGLETIVKILAGGHFVDASPSLVFFLKTISWVFPNLSAFDLKASVAYGLPLDPVYLCWAAVYGCSYSILMMIFTFIVFKHRDIC
jgi:ABC-type transport system involved in multi-copper enzyme maturation permease subunit